jgi:hypothetical protein
VWKEGAANMTDEEIKKKFDNYEERLSLALLKLDQFEASFRDAVSQTKQAYADTKSDFHNFGDALTLRLENIEASIVLDYSRAKEETVDLLARYTNKTKY